MEYSIDSAKTLLKITRLKDYSTKTVTEIVKEESGAYLTCDKSLEDACKVIASRVQLYLDEGK